MVGLIPISRLSLKCLDALRDNSDEYPNYAREVRTRPLAFIDHALVRITREAGCASSN